MADGGLETGGRGVDICERMDSLALLALRDLRRDFIGREGVERERREAVFSTIPIPDQRLSSHVHYH